ncbi:MAG: hypothetical protein DSY58_01700, partial [Desulfobulbus sp.]
MDIDEATLPPGAVQTEGTDPTTVNVPNNSIATDIDGYKPPDQRAKVEGVVYEDT